MPEENFNQTENTIIVLSEIANDVLIGELRRRADAENMTVEELIAASDTNWKKAVSEADALKKQGHE